MSSVFSNLVDIIGLWIGGAVTVGVADSFFGKPNKVIIMRAEAAKEGLKQYKLQHPLPNDWNDLIELQDIHISGIKTTLADLAHKEQMLTFHLSMKQRGGQAAYPSQTRPSAPVIEILPPEREGPTSAVSDLYEED